jgi:DNA repair protein RadC
MIMTTLYVSDSGSFREACDDEILRRAQGVLGKRFRSGSPVMTSPARTKEFLRMRLGALDYEVFGCLYLTKRQRLIKAEDLFRGTIDGSSVHPREIVRSVILNGAAAVVLYHNHPSGHASPSQADEHITARLKEGLALIDVHILDHIIVGESTYSFAEHGLL